MEQNIYTQRESGVPCLVQVQNPRNRELPSNFGARGRPEKRVELGSPANSEQETDPVVAYSGASLGVLPEFQSWFYYFLAGSHWSTQCLQASLFSFGYGNNSSTPPTLG